MAQVKDTQSRVSLFESSSFHSLIDAAIINIIITTTTIEDRTLNMIPINGNRITPVNTTTVATSK